MNKSIKKSESDNFRLVYYPFFDDGSSCFGECIFIDKGILYLYDLNNSEMFSKYGALSIINVLNGELVR